jgi:hypothetical protein
MSKLKNVVRLTSLRYDSCTLSCFRFPLLWEESWA